MPSSTSFLKFSAVHLLSTGFDDVYSLRKVADQTSEILSQLDMPDVDQDRVNLIAAAALNLKILFFIAALHEPTLSEMESIVEDFIYRALNGAMN